MLIDIFENKKHFKKIMDRIDKMPKPKQQKFNAKMAEWFEKYCILRNQNLIAGGADAKH